MRAGGATDAQVTLGFRTPSAPPRSPPGRHRPHRDRRAGRPRAAARWCGDRSVRRRQPL